jgi:hypothetical protein
MIERQRQSILALSAAVLFIAGMGACGNGVTEQDLGRDASNNDADGSENLDVDRRRSDSERTGEGSTSEGSSAVSEGCKQAFESAAAVDPFHDTHKDLNPTFFSCRSVDEWLLGAQATSGLGISASRIYIENRCLFARAIENSPVCNDL